MPSVLKVNEVQSDTDLPLVFNVGNAERGRIDTSGNVGIGTNSPSYKLQIVGGNATGFLLDNGGQQYTQLLLQRNGAVNTGGDILIDGTAGTMSIRGLLAGPLLFQTSLTAGSPVERARFNTTGAFVLAGGTTTADGIGITFPATQSASSNANTLDDYEEGTWTVTLRDTAGGTANNSKYSVRLGDYTKVGNLVSLRFAVQLDGTSGATGTLGASGLQIGGIPFTAASGLVSASIYLYSGFTGAGFQKGMATAYMSGNVFTEIFNGGQNLLGTNTTNSFYMWGNIVYTV